ncbi:sialidase family protein [Pontibacter flavimaris]|uniref:exo-alpha-sialidase n=1 Tax=Pontibacter flavimaris TaxID=1797110 RepID=A0A1Q5PCR5_9BACT|nr:sialidase family protein [Pontibacter flavimaris]OKL40050.1 glycosyl hydrolase [Pontibacter flavimaris]
MSRAKSVLSCLLLVLICSVSCSRSISTTSPATTAPSVNGVSITSTAPAVPVLRGTAYNPLLRVTLYVPAGGKSINFQRIKARLNGTALQDVEKLDVYLTGSEALFSTSNLIKSIKPTSEEFEVPLSIQAKPGKHYIWFSATLKETANIDNKVELRATQLTDANGKVYPVAEDGSTYAKRLGIALRKAGEDGSHTYRIPGIATTDKGTLVAVYDIRYEHAGDLPANIDVGMSRSTDGGKNWEPMQIIMDMGAPHENNGIGDPSILFDPATGKIWVAALWSKGNRSIAGSGPGLSPDETGQFVLVSSDDDGKTWSEPYSITGQIKNPDWRIYFNGPGNGIVMQNGTLVFPSQYWDEHKMPHSSIIYSQDNGKTWKSGIGAKANTTESQVVETTPGTLMLNMRDNRGRFRSVATTTDLGQTWVEHHTSYSALPDPVCMAGFIKADVRTKSGQQEVLFFSNVATPHSRYNITLKASTDLGETWQPENQLLIDERGTYGYSALTKIDDNTIGLLYEGVRELYFVRVPVSEVLN